VIDQPAAGFVTPMNGCTRLPRQLG
jgi:hypothetical protein